MSNIDPWQAILYLWTGILIFTLISKWQKHQRFKVNQSEYKNELDQLIQSLEQESGVQATKQDSWYFFKLPDPELAVWIGLFPDGLRLRIRYSPTSIPNWSNFLLEYRKPKRKNDEPEHKPGFKEVNLYEDIFTSYQLWVRGSFKRHELHRDASKYLQRLIQMPGSHKLRTVRKDEHGFIFMFNLYDSHWLLIERIFERLRQIPPSELSVSSNTEEDLIIQDNEAPQRISSEQQKP